MRTRILEFSIIGTFIGFLVGIIFSLILNFSFSDIIDLKMNELFLSAQSGTFLISLLIIFVSTLFCTAAGALIGIGVPKFNTKPQKGHFVKVAIID